MLEAGQGVLVGITSDSAKVGDIGHAPYAAAKAALSSFLKTIVREYGSGGVRASCVAPGPIDTPMLRSTFGSQDLAGEGHRQAHPPRPRRAAGHARPRSPRPFGSSAPTRAFVAGEHLSVGGGVTMNA